MYLFGRVLRLGRFPALIAGITYQLSAFFLVSVVFTMIIAAAAWLPLLLAIIEIMVRKQEDKGTGPFVPIVYVVVGAVALGIHVLAGHPEILVYTLMVMAYYALLRLVLLWRRVGSWQPALRLGLWLALMVGLGLGLGSVQLIPLLELVTRNFREGSVTYADVVGWAYPTRQILTFLMPDFFGNPAHHGYWDLVSRQWVAVDRIFWGIKNYVEAGSYVGILPLVLASVRRARACGRSIAATGATSGSLPHWRGVAAVRLWHAALCPALLWPARHQATSLALPLGLSLHAEHRRPGRLWRPGSGAQPGDRRDRQDAPICPRLVPGYPDAGARSWRRAGAAGRAARRAGRAGHLCTPGRPRPGLGGEGPGGIQQRPDAALLPVAQPADLRPDADRQRHRPARQPLPASTSGCAASRCRASQSGSHWPCSSSPSICWSLAGASTRPPIRPGWSSRRRPSNSCRSRPQDGEPWRLTTYQPAGQHQDAQPQHPLATTACRMCAATTRSSPPSTRSYMRAIEGQGELLYNQIAPIYGAGKPELAAARSAQRALRGDRGRDPQPRLRPGLRRRGPHLREHRRPAPRLCPAPRRGRRRSRPADRLRTFDPRQVILLDDEPRLRQPGLPDCPITDILAPAAGQRRHLRPQHRLCRRRDARRRLAGPGRQLLPRLEGLPLRSQSDQVPRSQR